MVLLILCSSPLWNRGYQVTRKEKHNIFCFPVTQKKRRAKRKREKERRGTI